MRIDIPVELEPDEIYINNARFIPESELKECVTEEVPPPSKFQVGDFVRAVKVYDESRGYRNFGLEVGMCGKVVFGGNKGTIGVEFPGVTEGHNCNGLAADNHGRWIPAPHLEHIG